MTQGIGASAFDRGYLGQIPAELVPGRLVNLSSSGARVADVLDRQLPALRVLGIVPALVTVLIGSNDLLRHRREFPTAFGRMLDELPVGSVVASLPNPTKAAQAANARLARAAASGAVVIAELRGPDAPSWKGKLAADHFHPNDLGYANLAGAFARTLRPNSG